MYLTQTHKHMHRSSNQLLFLFNHIVTAHHGYRYNNSVNKIKYTNLVRECDRESGATNCGKATMWLKCPDLP